MYEVILKKGEEKKILNGFCWVYANEVYKVEGSGKQGEVCKVLGFDRRFIALGYINHLSKILVRILTYRQEPIDYDFYYQRIKNANYYRVNLGYDNNYRVVFGESDFLPALIVDKYGEYLCCQFLALGVEKIKDMVVKILVDIFNPKGIYERSDVSVRKKEGLEEKTGVLYGEVPDLVEITENGVQMFVDIKYGQKTGYFLDQKENRDNLKNYCNDKKTLDCFCNVGGFSMCMAKYGAKSVTAVDISDRALQIVEMNAKQNNFTNITTLKADVFEALREYRRNGEKFDVVVLDPPAFTKSADTVKDAIRGYKDINIQALKIINKGGFLVTCSCSQHLTVKLFCDMITQACRESNVTAKMVEIRTQGKDHANIVGYDEGLYLKVAVLYVM